MTLHPQYLTDSKGRKTAVLLPYSEYEQLVEGVKRKKFTKRLKPRKTAKITDDWFDQLTKPEQKSIFKGIDDINSGNTVSHQKVTSKVQLLLKKAK